MTQRVLKNARIATMSQTGTQTDGYGLINAGYVAIEADKVEFVGDDSLLGGSARVRPTALDGGRTSASLITD
jgi:hypothetical protein